MKTRLITLKDNLMTEIQLVESELIDWATKINCDTGKEDVSAMILEDR